jgi:hypothetical protein
MTPKEKAEELLDKYYIEHYCWSGNGYDVDKITTKQCQKQCALIAVDELIDSHLLLTTTHDSKPSIRCKRYWQEVKKEIELL